MASSVAEGSDIHFNPLEMYFQRMAALDIENQYVATDGEVYKKCVLGHIFKWLGLCTLLRGFCGESIVKAKEAFAGRIAQYAAQRESALPVARRIQLVKDAETKFNELIDHINSKRPENGRLKLPADFKFIPDQAEQFWKQAGKQAAINAATTIPASTTGHPPVGISSFSLPSLTPPPLAPPPPSADGQPPPADAAAPDPQPAIRPPQIEENAGGKKGSSKEKPS